MSRWSWDRKQGKLGIETDLALADVYNVLAEGRYLFICVRVGGGTGDERAIDMKDVCLLNVPTMDNDHSLDDIMVERVQVKKRVVVVRMLCLKRWSFEYWV